MKTVQPDLFACPLPPGLALRPALVDPAEARHLVAHIDALALQPFRFQGWTGKRLTASFGWHYDFDDARLARRRADGFDRHAVPLEPGGADHLHGEARRDWEHGIAPMAETRWSITFRSLRA